MASPNYLTMKDIVAAIPRVDDPDALVLAEDDRALAAALDMCRPTNWRGTGMGQELLLIARDEGIPLAWVPRSHVLKELAHGATAGERLRILTSHQAVIIEDCDLALRDCTDDWIRDSVTLARASLKALRGGHHEAAMALSVCIGEKLASWAATPRVRSFDSRADRDAWNKKRAAEGKYRWANIEVAAVGTNISPFDFRYQVLIAPIPRFFTPWWPTDESPAPLQLSRHVVAHQPSVTHMNNTNALLAIMLVTSILREQQDWSAEVRATDASHEE